MEFKPLPEQLEIIDSKNKNLLVSASAGSGKTTVMIQRICKLISDGCANPKDLLVMTFTTSSASEMKQKLYDNLRQKNVDQEILDQVPTSDISTIHSFCSRLLKKYFYVLGLAPNFEIADEKKSLKIKKEIANNVLTQYAKKHPDQYFVIMQNFAPNRKTENIVDIVLKLDEFSESFEDKSHFCDSMLLLYDNPNVALDFLNKHLIETKTELENKLKALQKDMMQLDLPVYVEFLNKLLGELCKISENFDFFKNIQNISDISVPTLKKDNQLEISIFENLESVKNQTKTFVSKYKEKTFVQAKDFEKSIDTNKMLTQNLLEIWKNYCDAYEQYKGQKSILDYSDLEQKSLILLSNEKIREELHQTYKYIFVDEYQDTNHVQNKIVDLLCGEDNKFLVGDVKQSIYGFRRSKPQIFLDLEQKCKTDEKSETKYLNANFRSDSKILNFVNFVFDNIMTVGTSGIDYRQTGRFRGMKNFEYQIPKVKICLYDKKDEKQQKALARGVYKVEKQMFDQTNSASQKEACIVAKQIVSLLGKPLDDGKKIDYCDITILVRKRGDGYNQFCDKLSSLGLPIFASNSADILQNPETEKFLNLLKLCTNVNDDIALCSCMVGYFDFDEQQLANIRLENPQEEYFYQAVQKYTKNDDIFQKITYFYQQISQLQKDISVLGGHDAINNFFEKIAYFERLEIMQANMRLDVLKLLTNQLLAPEYNFNIPKFLDYIQNGGKINLPDRQSGDSNFVNITTIHSSKGLEYPIVFLVDCGSDFNKSKVESISLNDEFGLGFKYFDTDAQISYDDIVLQAIKQKNRQEEFAEKLRLLYVALTRAKNMLCIVGGCDFDNLKHIESKFDITSQNNFLNLILLSFDQDVLDKLKLNKNFVWQTKDFDVNFEGYTEQFENPELVSKIVFGKGDQKLSNQFEKRLNQNFEIKNIALKNSVSELMKEENGYQNNTQIVQTLTIDEHLRGKADTLLGTQFHKVLEMLDYKDFDNVQKISQQIKSCQDIDTNQITVEKVSSALKILNNLFESKKVFKEKQFIFCVPYNKIIKSDCDDLVLVQGIVDAFAVDQNQAIMVDFKLSNKSSQALVKTYKKQLDLYAFAIKQAYKVETVHKYILNLNFAQLIKVD